MELFIQAEPKQKGNSKRILRVGRPGSTRPMLVSSQKDLAAEQLLVALALPRRPLRPLEGPLALHVTFVLPVPQSWPKEKRAAALAGAIWPTEEIDRGNLLKLIEDALQTAGYYVNDSQVCGGDVGKVYGEPAGYRIRLEVLEGSGAAAWGAA